MSLPDVDALLLRKNISGCAERIRSLGYSLQKTRALFPLSIGALDGMTEDQKESIDAMILRYSQCVSMIQEQIFRGIALVEQEDLSGKSNRDKSLLMEKLGAIQSADAFGTATVLRNKLAHHYPEESREQLDKLNSLVGEVEFVMAVFEHLVQYARHKGFLAPGADSSAG